MESLEYHLSIEEKRVGALDWSGEDRLDLEICNEICKIYPSLEDYDEELYSFTFTAEELFGTDSTKKNRFIEGILNESVKTLYSARLKKQCTPAEKAFVNFIVSNISREAIDRNVERESANKDEY